MNDAQKFKPFLFSSVGICHHSVIINRYKLLFIHLTVN